MMVGNARVIRGPPHSQSYDFFVAVPKKRKRVESETAAATKRRKEDEVVTAAPSAQELVADAMAAVEQASKVKVMQIKPKKSIPLTKEQKKVLDKVAERLAKRNTEEERDRKLLKSAEAGALKTLAKDGGYNLTDVWAKPGKNRSTLSKPKVSGILASIPAPGTSYNPRLEDHQAAVAEAVAEEQAEEARRRLLMEKTMGVNKLAPSVPGARPATRNPKLAALLPCSIGMGEEAGADADPDWEAEAERAAEAYLASLDERDPDAEEGDEDMGVQGTVKAAGAAASSSAAQAKGKDGKKEHFYALAAQKRAQKASADPVEEALAAVEAEEAAKAARKAAREQAKVVVQQSVKAGKALPYAIKVRDEGIRMVPVPLSSELTGSLRTMKPLGAGAVVLDAMAGMVARGDTAARRIAHAPMREDLATGAVLPVPMGTLRRTKKLGHPYKEMEFPRRKQFEPAANAAKEAEEQRFQAKIKKHAQDEAKGAARKAARLEAAKAMGLELE